MKRASVNSQNKYPLRPLIDKVPLGDQPRLREMLFDALGLSRQSRTAFSFYVSGERMLTLDQAKRIERIFARWNITCPWAKN